MQDVISGLKLDRDGCAVATGIVGPSLIGSLIAAVSPLLEGARRKGGVRALLALSAAAKELSESKKIRDLVEPILGKHAFVTRSILFDKSPEANWDVVWHQDTTIAVTEQHKIPGFGPWSTKAGVPHVQPPQPVLEGIITARIHLDACDADNGPLLVVPGSHSRLIPDAEIDGEKCDKEAVAVCCNAGDVILMRPLILHASRKAVVATHRRVIHLEFAAEPLPPPLMWAHV